MILANTLFKCVCYHPEEYQIITSGTDRRVSKAAAILFAVIPKHKVWGLLCGKAPEPPQKVVLQGGAEICVLFTHN